MKKIVCLVVAFVLTLSMFSTVSAQELVFVSPDGADNNDGSFESPFATLQKAVDEVADGGTVYMREGNYSSGAKLSKTVAIKAYEGEKVVFANAQKGNPVPVSAEERKFIEVSEARAKVHYLEGIERIGEVREDGVSHALLVDGKYKRPASLGDESVTRINFEKTEKQSDGKYEYLGEIDFDSYVMKHYPEGYVTGTLGGKDFVSMYKFTPGSKLFTITAELEKEQEYKSEDDGLTYTSGLVWFEYNAAHINKPGEWAAMDGKVYLYPEKSAKEIEYLADYETFIAADNVDGIKISGIEFSKTLGNAIYLKNCDNAVVSACGFVNITDTAVLMEECENPKIFNCEFNDNATKCIEFKNTNGGTIDNCGFENNAVLCRGGTPCIDITGDSNTFSKSEFVTAPCGAVRLCGKGNIVTGCKIEKSAEFSNSAAIYVDDSSSDNIIEQNYIADNEKNVATTGRDSVRYSPFFGFYGNATIKYTEEAQEDISKGISVEPATAVYFSKLSSNTVLRSNVIEKCNYGIILGASDGNNVSGNVFYTGLQYVLLEPYTDPDTDEEDKPENNHVHDNIICDKNDINWAPYKLQGNLFENNIKSAHANALNRDGSILIDNIRTKIPEFENIDFGGIGRYEVSEEKDDVKVDTPAPLPDTIKVLLNGEAIDFEDVAPKVINDRTMVPLRAIFEALGAEVDWDDKTKTVTAKKDDVTIKMTIGAKTFSRNEEKVELDSPATIVDSRTLVPVRAIAESFGSKVGWTPESKTVTIEDVKEEAKDEKAEEKKDEKKEEAKKAG